MMTYRISKPSRKATIVLERTALLAAGFVVLDVALSENAHAFASARMAIEELCTYMQGSLGGLLTATAAVGAVTAAAFGNLKACYSLIVTGIGAYCISSAVGLYFPEAEGYCNGGGGTGRTMKAALPTGKTTADIDAAAIAIATGKQGSYPAAATGANAQEEKKDFDPGLKEMVETF